MGEPTLRALVLDDSAATAADLAELLRAEGYQVASALEPAEVLRQVGSEELDLLVVDLEISGLDALQLIRRARERAPRYLSILALQVRDDRERRLAALRLGADDVLAKPWDPEELRVRISRSARVRRRVDDLLQEAASLRALAITDALTGLFNRRFFQERLKEEFRRAQRYDDPLALIMLDVDHFKDVNDRFGHPAGDQVLGEVARAVKQAVRDTDLVARVGGEEFALLLPRTHLAGALTVAERVWKNVSEVRAGPGGRVRVTGSLGVSGYPGRSVSSPEQLLQTADEALYRAKREGRNKICLFQQVSFFEPPARTG